jgi:hypothetical protein
MGGHTVSGSEHAQPAPRVQLIGIGLDGEGFRRLLAWVAEPDDLEERRRRGEIVKRGIAELLARVDHDDVNTQIRSALRFDHAPATWTWSPPQPSRN